MKKLTGTLKITANAGVEGVRPHFEIAFMPYVGRLNTKIIKAQTQEDLANLLIELRIAEDEAVRWAGKARVEGVVLISPFERTDAQLTEHGLLG